MQALKILGIVIAVTAVLIVLFFVSLGWGVFALTGAVVEEAIDSANPEISQTLTRAGGQLVIEVPFETIRGVKYTKIRLCPPPGSDSFVQDDPVSAENAASIEKNCFNGLCTVEIRYDDPSEIPKAVRMHIRNDLGRCIQTSFKTDGYLADLSYRGTIEFTDELKQALGIAGKDFEVGNLGSSSRMVWQLLGTKKARFWYPGPTTSDVLTIDGRVAAEIVYR